MTRNATNFLPDICRVQPVLLLILLSETLALITILLRYGLAPFAWTQFALTSLFYLWSVLGSAAIICQLRPLLDRMSLRLAAFLTYVTVLGVVLMISIAGQRIVVGHWQIDWLAVGTQLVVGALLGGIAVRYAYLGYQLHLREQGELSARLDALQARMRPHFLFNSLNSLASLVGSQDDRAEQAVEDLANLLRASLDNRSALTTWAGEKKLSEDYLRLESLRLGERLRIKWDDQLDPKTPMLPLLLQPLLENAIIHGIAPRPDGGEVTITTRQIKAAAHLVVTNPLSEDAPRHGNQFALANCAHRLEALYGETGQLQTGQSGQQFRAEIHFPAGTSA